MKLRPRQFSGVILYSLLAALPASAATRTVTYMGVAQSRGNTTEVMNLAAKTTCTLIIANHGSNAQKITSITANQFSLASGGGKTKRVTLNSTSESSTTIDTELLTTSSASDSCINAEMTQGAICLIQYPMISMSWMGKITYCSGTITVKDSSDSAPGSLVGGGALFLNQESMVLGGVLSGAYYASQTHVSLNELDDGNLATDSEGDFTGSYTADFLGAQNMNIFCGVACKAKALSTFSATECDEQCGYGNRSNALEGGSWTYHIPSYERKVSAAQTSYGENYATDPADYSGTSPETYDQVSRQHGVANTHFAGGMVYEMTIGSLNAICSGNRQFFEEGGTDFTHSDGVDGHAFYYPTLSSSYPPERLVCSHRHSRSDLFMRTGSSSPILVNGGNPF